MVDDKLFNELDELKVRDFSAPIHQERLKKPFLPPATKPGSVRRIRAKLRVSSIHWVRHSHHGSRSGRRQ